MVFVIFFSNVLMYFFHFYITNLTAEDNLCLGHLLASILWLMFMTNHAMSLSVAEDRCRQSWKSLQKRFKTYKTISIPVHMYTSPYYVLQKAFHVCLLEYIWLAVCFLEIVKASTTPTHAPELHLKCQSLQHRQQRWGAVGFWRLCFPFTDTTTAGMRRWDAEVRMCSQWSHRQTKTGSSSVNAHK